MVMSYSKTILCLANSRKFSGHCIAGKNISNGTIGSWIRPVSQRRTGELANSECVYQNGGLPELLDFMQVSFERMAPDSYQTENQVIDANNKWRFIKKATWSDVISALDTVPGELWTNGSDSSHGRNDRVPEPVAKTLRRSLYLLYPHQLCINVATEGSERKIRASFTFNTISYKFVVTDSIIEKKFLGQRDGIYPISDALACVSLGELFHGYAYKLVAAVLTPNMGA
jgi:hypothetical protein